MNINARIEDEISEKRSRLPATLAKTGNLLDAALALLPPEQQQALALKALECRLEIDAQAMRADLRYRASSLDMANTIDQVRELESSTRSDYTVKAEYQTASGLTSVEINKANNTVIIVIAVVIGVLVLLMFAK